MIRGSELMKQIRQIESEKHKEHRELEREKSKIRQCHQQHEKVIRQVEVVESRTKLMEETLSRVKETNNHKNMEIRELEMRLVDYRKQYCDMKDKLNRGEKLYDEVRTKFLEEVKKMNKALFQSKKFYTPESIAKKTKRLKEELRGMTFLPSDGQVNEGALIGLVEDNKRMESLVEELQGQIKKFDRMKDEDEDIRSEESMEEERKRFERLSQEKMALIQEITIEDEKMKEFQKEYELLKNDVESGMVQMGEYFCLQCKNPLNTLT